MNIYPGEFNELTRRATELLSDTSDVPRVLRGCFGEQHDLTLAGHQMVESIETLVRELRSFDASAEPTVTDTYQNPY
jgi:hypothetical protein